MTLSVIIPTYNRPDCVRRNLECLFSQDPRPDQVIIVDASTDDRTARVMEQFPDAIYLQNKAGRGNTPNSRNLALLRATGDIIAFLDDDAFVHPHWASALLATYGDPSISAVAGRSLNGMPGEETLGVDEIGTMRPDGTLTGNFAANPGRLVDIDHMIGCNMSLRRDVIARLGGFRDDYPAGPFGLCEETELCIRAKRMGVRQVFNPNALATHIGAAQPNSKRFGPKYTYYHARNGLVMLIRNYGIGPVIWKYLASTAFKSAIVTVRKICGAAAHFVATLCGLFVGIAAGLRLAIQHGTSPSRLDQKGTDITRHLSNGAPNASALQVPSPRGTPRGEG